MKRMLCLSASLLALSIGSATAAGAAEVGQSTQTSRINHSITGTTDGENANGAGGRRDNGFQSDAFRSSKGIIHAAQNNGSNNAMSTTDAIAVETVGSAAQTSSITAKVQTNTYLAGAGADRDNALANAATGAAGIVTLQQNNGDGNSVAAGNALFVKQSGTSEQTIRIGQEVGGDYSDDLHNDGFSSSARDNVLGQGSLDGATGLLTVQQNNGDMNALAIQNALTVNDKAGALDQTLNTSNTVSSNWMWDETTAARTNSLSGALTKAQGIITVQQNNGDGNAASIATAITADMDKEHASSAQTVRSSNTVVDTRSDDYTGGTSTGVRSNSLTGAFSGVQGIVTVDQNNGSNNATSISTAIAAGLKKDEKAGKDGKASQSVIMTGVVDGSMSIEASDGSKASERRNVTDGAFNAADGAPARGILTLRQNNGDNNSMSTATAVAVGDMEQQTVRGSATVTGAIAEDGPSVSRNNTLSNSFNKAEGIVSVQQNNGSNNVMGSAVAIGVAQGASTPLAQTAALDATVAASESYSGAGGAGIVLSNRASNVFNGAQGILTLQQNNGNNNAIQSVITVSASGSFTGGR
ncbi:hypothetical protein [Indioceanicola profundi]|uniref:hypothetical protein n=1 Tax=Indioceanicola profundi TaxID=2220096 RepID=UPI000E6ABCAB|nr:hypothetical protein [Indioceanicola profundi]